MILKYVVTDLLNNLSSFSMLKAMQILLQQESKIKGKNQSWRVYRLLMNND